MANESVATLPGDPAAGARTESGARALEAVRGWDGPILVRSIALTGIFVMLVFYTLYFAKPVLMPIAVAFLLSMLLTPLVQGLTRMRISEPVGAAMVLAALLALVGGGIYLLAEPAQRWIERAPYDLRKLEYRLREIKRPIKQIQEATSKVEAITSVNEKPAGKPEVSVQQASISEVVVGATPKALAGMGTLVILLYFWLAGGDNFLRKLVRLFPRLQDKKRAVDTVRTIQTDISRYLLTITLINAGLGLLTAAMLWVMGVPNAMLWGVLACILNFAPFIGAAVTAVLLSFVGFLTFPEMSQALAVPGAFLVLSIIEGQLVTPMILGHRLALSPMAIFVTLMVWGWMWGIPGALIAVPLLASVKIVCERIETLNPIAQFLGR